MMKANSDNEHWENIYATKNQDEVSWTEEVPEISMSFIKGFHLPITAAIIDIGGGESKLVDCLLDAGFVNITVLDISERSIEKAKERLGVRSEKIHWVAQDITEFETNQLFDCWHDRATFHFLTELEEILKYTNLAKRFIKKEGYLVLVLFPKMVRRNVVDFPSGNIMRRK